MGLSVVRLANVRDGRMNCNRMTIPIAVLLGADE